MIKYHTIFHRKIALARLGVHFTSQGHKALSGFYPTAQYTTSTVVFSPEQLLLLSLQPNLPIPPDPSKAPLHRVKTGYVEHTVSVYLSRGTLVNRGASNIIANELCLIARLELIKISFPTYGLPISHRPCPSAIV